MFSVVIPTYNRANTLRLTLRSVLAQQAEIPYEVIVVDNNSADRTREVVEELERGAPVPVRYVLEPVQGSSAARNAGAAAARGGIVAFLDDDVVAQPDWLMALAGAYAQVPDAWAVGGRVTLRFSGPLPAWLSPLDGLVASYLSEQDLGDGLLRIEYPRGLISANLSVRREALERVGGFSGRLGRFGNRLLSGEDLELCRRIQRAGGEVYYCGGACVAHLVTPERLTRAFFRRRAYWQGRTEAVFSQRRGVVSAAVKDVLKAAALYATQQPQQALRHELAAWKTLGYLVGRIREAGGL
ncbi:MAG: glycosyltransferase family 2 protein [Armatimonadetes bacterium]|nr:glycosyltransferase family 2 protein [Armatimonadota bacterium]MDW8153890.1 glycosyltransferase [Armatimonadota bacterium]